MLYFFLLLARICVADSINRLPSVLDALSSEKRITINSLFSILTPVSFQNLSPAEVALSQMIK
jgi:hypothetical protein